MRQTRSSTLLTLLFALAVAGFANEPTEIREELTVKEHQVLIHAAKAEALDPSDLTLSVADRDQLITRLDRLASKSEPWNIVIWIDRGLTPPTVLSPAAAALGQRAAKLCDLGFVTLVVADPLPRTVLNATRNVVDLDRALGALASTARLTRGSGNWQSPSKATVLDRIQAMPAELSVYATYSPQLILLVGGDSQASQEELKTLAEGDPKDLSPWAEGVLDLGKKLAADRWLMMGVVLRPAPIDRAPPPDPVEQLRQQSTGETRFFIDLLQAFSARNSQTKWVNEEALTANLLPRLAPILTLVQQTGGSVITQEAQLDLALKELAFVWRLWFRLRDLATEGIQPLKIRALEASELQTRAPLWVNLDR